MTLVALGVSHPEQVPAQACRKTTDVEQLPPLVVNIGIQLHRGSFFALSAFLRPRQFLPSKAPKKR